MEFQRWGIKKAKLGVLGRPLRQVNIWSINKQQIGITWIFGGRAAMVKTLCLG